MYAILVDDEMVAVEVIVGDAEWASLRLGGTWVSSEELVGVGWRYDNGTWVVPPPPPIVEELIDEAGES